MASPVSTTETAPAPPMAPAPGRAVVAPGPQVKHDRHNGNVRAFAVSFAETRRGLVGLGLLVFMALFSFVGPFVYHTNQVTTNLSAVALHPSSAHPLGTDEQGYDVLGRLMLAGQSTLEIGFAAALIASFIGTTFGAVAGFLGGWVDSVMMRVLDTVLAVPPLLLILVAASIFVPTVPVVIAIIAIVSWLITARLVRGECLSLREREYVAAATAGGATKKRIIVRHVVPNLVDVVVVQTSLEMANAILLLAALSFLGLGPPLPSTNWGDMLSNGLNFIYDGYWWLIYPAGICIVLTVVALNLVGDAVRDAFDVRLRTRRG
jgi:peptide/nickel transport system permease protein